MQDEEKEPEKDTKQMQRMLRRRSWRTRRLSERARNTKSDCFAGENKGEVDNAVGGDDDVDDSDYFDRDEILGARERYCQWRCGRGLNVQK